MSKPTPDLSTLLRQTDISDHADILNAANAALKKSKTDKLAIQTRIVALLKLDRYQDALKAFEDGGDNIKTEAPLEYAYALYKSGEWEQASDVARKYGKESRALLHVAGQTNYRLEKFGNAAEIYAQLSSTLEDSREENDLRIQTAAVDAQLEWTSQGHLASSRKPQKDDMQAFERAYNSACACIAREEFGQAEVLLNRARQLCTALEDISEEDKKSELAPIIVQQIYVLSRQGKDKEAKKLCESVDIHAPSDPSTQLQAISNVLSTIPQENPFIAYKQYHSVPPPRKNDQPFEYQNSIITQNSYALELASHKFDGVKRSTSATISKDPSSVHTISLSAINAAARTELETGPKAIKLLIPILAQRPNDIGLLLTIVQLYILTNNPSAAANLLHSFYTRIHGTKDAQIGYTPALVATTVALFTSQGRSSNARTVLTQAAQYWRQKDVESPPIALLQTAAAKWLEDPTPINTDSSKVSSLLPAAKDMFEYLHENDPSDLATIAGLVAATAATNPSKLDQALLKKLTPAADLVKDIDAAALEDAGVARPAEALVGAGAKRAADSGPTKPKKKKKLAPSRKPKDFVEGKAMDPERWLPVRDRSNFRPKGKKGKGKALAGGTQGGIEDEKPQKVAQPSAGVQTAKKNTKNKKGKKK